MKEFIELVKQLGAAIEDGDPGQISEIYVFHVLRYINEYEERESALIAKCRTGGNTGRNHKSLPRTRTFNSR